MYNDICICTVIALKGFTNIGDINSHLLEYELSSYNEEFRATHELACKLHVSFHG